MSDGNNRFEENNAKVDDSNKNQKTSTTEPKDRLLALHSYLTCEQNISVIERQNHIKRMQNLRKELNFIKETDWMYDPVE